MLIDGGGHLGIVEQLGCFDLDRADTHVFGW
jgi:hypothetical protein